MNGRTNEQVNFKTSRTATKARAGFSVNAAAVRRLPFCISRRIVLDRVHEELSKKKSESFIDFFLSSKKTLTRRLIKKSPIIKKSEKRSTDRTRTSLVCLYPTTTRSLATLSTRSEASSPNNLARTSTPSRRTPSLSTWARILWTPSKS